jgi:hypothetical protein
MNTIHTITKFAEPSLSVSEKSRLLAQSYHQKSRLRQSAMLLRSRMNDDLR